MIKTPSTLAVALSLLLPSLSNAAMPALDLSTPFRALLANAKDSRYDLVKEEARHSLDLLKKLSNYAKDVSKDSEKLKDEMNDRHYNDMVDTRLRPLMHDAAALKESIKNIHSREENRVKTDLKKAKSGDFGPITETMARIDKFRVDNQPKVETLQGKIKEVEGDYRHDYANAQAALAQFKQTVPVPDLLAAKPKLIKKISLEPVFPDGRPLAWKIVLVKEHGDYNDPRFGQIPRTVLIQDGQQQITYVVDIH